MATIRSENERSAIPRDSQGRVVEVERQRAGADRPQEIERSMRFLAGGFSIEATAGAAALVLAILGLANVAPVYMTAIATIAVGAALLFKGGSVAARFRQLRYETGGGTEATAELAGGMSAEIAGGAAGVTLGVLALLGIVPGTLIASAVIVFGGTLLLSAAETYRIGHLRGFAPASPSTHEITFQTVQASSGTDALVGTASVVLGILALTGTAPETLVLVALLSVGGAALFSGLAVTSRVATVLTR